MWERVRLEVADLPANCILDGSLPCLLNSDQRPFGSKPHFTRHTALDRLTGQLKVLGVGTNDIEVIVFVSNNVPGQYANRRCENHIVNKLHRGEQN